MNAETVLQLLDTLTAVGVETWVDGGWGVDALIGRQTREHDDLDVVVRLSDAPTIEAALAELGYVKTVDELPTRFVLGHVELGSVDLHTVSFDDEGGGLQRQPSGKDFRYPPEGFVTGSILSRPVRCISADVQVRCHLGYTPKEKDIHDMVALREEFGIELPEPYRGYDQSFGSTS